jgi:hypothetical protein
MHSKNILRKAVLALSIILGIATTRADFDESGFESLREGDLFGQAEWHPQGSDGSGRYSDAENRAEVRVDSSQGKTLVWLAGFPATQQTRLVKSFRPVAGDNVLVKFDFMPGNATVGGRLIFDSGNGKDVVSVRFVKGSLQVSSGKDAEAVDTGLKFEKDDWNKVELQCSLKTHQMTVSLNGKKSDPIALPETLTQFQRVILFGGGIDFESLMDNLSIESVTSF